MELDLQNRRDTLAFDAVLYRDKGLEVTPSVVVIESSFGRLPWGRPHVIAVEDIERVWHADPLGTTPWRSRLRTALRGRSRDKDHLDNTLVLALRGGRVHRAVAADKPADAYNALRCAMRTG
eukprot:IDg17761t1